MSRYEFLLNKIVNNIDNKDDQEYIKTNIKSISKDLNKFSRLFKNLIDISISDDTYIEKIDKISKLSLSNNNSFTKEESSKIMDALYLTGGGDEEESDKTQQTTKLSEDDKKNIENLKEIHKNVDNNIIFCFSNMGLIGTKLLTNFPKYGLLIISKFFSDLSSMYNFDWHSFADFTKKLDWIFIYLFVLASIPMIGQFIDIVIIIRAVRQERFFLAIITFITSFVSMFVLHIVDLGLVMKFLYFMDVFSYNNKNNQVVVPSEGEEQVFFDNTEKHTILPTKSEDTDSESSEASPQDIEKLDEAVKKVSEAVGDKENISLEDKKLNLENLKSELKKENKELVEEDEEEVLDSDTEQPDTEQSDTEQSDTEQPDTEQPDTEQPDTEQHDMEPKEIEAEPKEILYEEPIDPLLSDYNRKTEDKKTIKIGTDSKEIDMSDDESVLSTDEEKELNDFIRAK